MMKHIIRYFLRNVPRKYLQRVSHICTKAVSVFYVGNRVECPICGKHYRKFLPYGYVTPRENALCPSCLSLERHRTLWLFLKEQTTLFSTKGKMLHIAPELAFMKYFDKLPQLDYVTADLESPLAKVKTDVRDMPFKDDTFDIVMCNHVLEHVEEDIQAIREIQRVMKPGGWGILLCPINTDREVTYENEDVITPEEREKHFGQRDHVREYGRDYGSRLAYTGLKVEAIDFTGSRTHAEVIRYALAPDTIYLVRKE